MLCQVFKLYDRGLRREPENVREGASYRGTLMYQSFPLDKGGKVYIASLLSPTNATAMLIPSLVQASLVRLDSRGLLLRGIEEISRNNSRNTRRMHYEQAWLCKPLNDAQPSGASSKAPLDAVVEPTFT